MVHVIQIDKTLDTALYPMATKTIRIMSTRNSTATQMYMPQEAAFSRTSLARFDSAVSASAVSSTCPAVINQCIRLETGPHDWIK